MAYSEDDLERMKKYFGLDKIKPKIDFELTNKREYSERLQYNLTHVSYDPLSDNHIRSNRLRIELTNFNNPEGTRYELGLLYYKILVEGILLNKDQKYLLDKIFSYGKDPTVKHQFLVSDELVKNNTGVSSISLPFTFDIYFYTPNPNKY